MTKTILMIIGGAVVFYVGYTIYNNNTTNNVQGAIEAPRPLYGQSAITPPKAISTIITEQVNTTAASINNGIDGFFNKL